jgi:hypothetical protein
VGRIILKIMKKISKPKQNRAFAAALAMQNAQKYTEA